MHRQLAGRLPLKFAVQKHLLAPRPIVRYGATKAKIVLNIKASAVQLRSCTSRSQLNALTRFPGHLV
jgi:hypothetical protein